MDIIFDSSLYFFAKDFYVDFEQFEINLWNDGSITLSEYELSVDGEELYSCMYSFVKIQNEYKYIEYGTKDYKKHFPKSFERNKEQLIARINSKKFIDKIKDNQKESYELSDFLK